MAYKVLLLSDIHGNLAALGSVLANVKLEQIKKVILLGDIIDYGPHSNEVIARIQEIPQEKIIVNIWGNHEQAVIYEIYDRFSSERGRTSAMYTRSCLTAESFEYLEQMEQCGKKEFILCGRKCLAVHGGMEDVFWKAVDTTGWEESYAEYDYVFSGHSHVPQYIQKMYPSKMPEYRNQKRTVFLNPGSVGQPRNHNPKAQFAVIDMESEEVCFKTAEYEIEREIQEFDNRIPAFYWERLRKGV